MRPEDDLTGYGYAPGNYWCVCRDCSKRFDGDKRAWRCAACATEQDAIRSRGEPR